MKRILTGFVCIAALVAIMPATAAFAQDGAELIVRLGRLENQIRQLSGKVEQLEFQNRKLEEQLQRFQKDTELRFQDQAGGAKPASPARANPAAQGGGSQPTQAPRRGDAFDPNANPAAPGAPRQIGTTPPTAPRSPQAPNPQPAPGAPIRLQNFEPPVQPVAPRQQADQGTGQGIIPQIIEDDETGSASMEPNRRANGQPILVIPDQEQNQAIAPVAGLAAASVAGQAQTELDQAIALHRRGEYASAETSLRQFLQDHPNHRNVVEATYWLGESYLKRGQFREAAEQYLKISTEHKSSPLGPDSLLKLGVALNGLGAHEEACSTFREVERKYPNANPNLKRGVEQEARRARCIAS